MPNGRSRSQHTRAANQRRVTQAQDVISAVPVSTLVENHGGIVVIEAQAYDTSIQDKLDDTIRQLTNIKVAKAALKKHNKSQKADLKTLMLGMEMVSGALGIRKEAIPTSWGSSMMNEIDKLNKKIKAYEAILKGAGHCGISESEAYERKLKVVKELLLKSIHECESYEECFKSLEKYGMIERMEDKIALSETRILYRQYPTASREISQQYIYYLETFISKEIGFKKSQDLFSKDYFDCWLKKTKDEDHGFTQTAGFESAFEEALAGDKDPIREFGELPECINEFISGGGFFQ